MPSSRWDGVVHDIRRIAGLAGAAHLSDRQLLDAFVARRDETAFEILVRRYGPMVFGLCKRLLRHSQDAEDAFQATFMVLVRKASTLREPEALGNWLYGVANRTALQARMRAARRRRKEAEVPAMQADDAGGEAAANLELQALLDRELNRLPDKYRAPVVLCDLLGKTKRQAAEELRCPEGTVSSRLARGRQMLKKRLAHRGPALFGPANAIMLEQTAAHTMPLTLCSTTAKAAVLVANGTTAVAAGLTPNVAALMQGVMKSMLITKLMPTVAVVLAVLLLGGTAGLVASGWGGGEAGDSAADQPKAGDGAALVARNDVRVDENQGPPKKVQKDQMRYEGKDFNAWRNILLTDLKAEVRAEAIRALGAFGVSGYPDEATAAILEEMRKYDWMNDEDRNSVVLTAALVTLPRIGPQAFAALAKELESKNVNDRRLAAVALGKGDGALAVRPLLQALNDHDREVRNLALGSFWGMRGWPPDLTVAEKRALVPVLVAVLGEEDGAVREKAVGALTWIGPEAKAAVPTLIKVLNEEPRAGSKWVYKDGSKGKQKDTALRHKVVKALGSIGSSAKEAVPALIAAMKDTTDTKFSLIVAETIPQIGKDAVPALIAVLEDADSTISDRHYAAIALGQIGPDAKLAVPALITEVEKTGHKKFGPVDSYAAAQALGLIGPDAKEAVPALTKFLDHNQYAAAQALGRIGPDAKDAVPALIKHLESSVARAKQAKGLSDSVILICNALGNIGSGAKEAAPLLRELQDTSPESLGFNWSPDRFLEVKNAAKTALEKIQK